MLHTNLMNSPGHKANIHNGSFKQVGNGFATGQYQSWDGAFVTQDFAKSGNDPVLLRVAAVGNNPSSSDDHIPNGRAGKRKHDVR